jgi:tetratricopeptide (TPR) repeat protein
MRKPIFILLLSALPIFASDDLVAALKALDAGNKAKAEAILKTMHKTKKPDDPEALLLEALLNDNGEEAKAVYEFIYEEYPDFKYADLCLFRLYSYNYAIGNYITAENYLKKLRKEYPNSPYAKAERDLPKVANGDGETENAANTSEKFTIQVGAFSNAENAERLANEFRNKGYSTNVGKKIVGSSIFNVVTVGVYSSREQAENRARKIKAEFGVNSRVIKLKR